MSLMDDISANQEKAEKNEEESGENIDYTKGWDTADNFRANYCSKIPVHLEKKFFQDTSKETGNPNGGLVYGLKKQLYDETKKEYKTDFSEALKKQINSGKIFDNDSFTKENGCLTNLITDDGNPGSMTQICKPGCRFKFKIKDKSTTIKTDTTKK